MNTQTEKNYYIIPHKRNNFLPQAQVKIHNPSSVVTVLEYQTVDVDRRIGGKIKTLNDTGKLIQFAENSTLDQKNIRFNSENWALWFNKLSNSVSFTKSLSKGTCEKIITIVDKMLVDIPSCPPGTCSQIAKAAGNLELNNINLRNWVFSNAINNLHSITPKEFYMLIHGAQKLLNQSELRKLLTSYSDRINDLEQEKVFTQEIRPQGIACLLKGCAKAEWRGHLSEVLLKLAKLMKRDDLISTIDLIEGLSLYAYTDPEVRMLLGQIEAELAKMTNLPLVSLSIAMSHFATCGFIPSILLEKVKAALQDPNNKIWDKISLFHSLALLGIKEEKVLFLFDDLMQSISQPLDGEKKAFTKIYLQDLVRLVHIAAVFSSDTNEPLVITEIIEYLILNLSRLKQEDRTRLIAPLRAFGRFEIAKEIGTEVYQSVTRGKDQMEVTQAIINYFKNIQSLKQLKIFSEGDVKGVKVDILIVGFNYLNIRQKPMILEVDGCSHWACNQLDHILGKTLLRSKALKRAGCELASFDQRKGVDVITKQVLAYLCNKTEKWTNTAPLNG